jgi:DNA-binding NarL/FixJ family response regulator
MSTAPAGPLDIWPDYARRDRSQIRLVLIDDHPLVREGIASLLSLESDMQLCAEAGDIATGIDLVRHHEPDLVITDLAMRGCRGAVAVERLQAACDGVRILVLTADDSLESMRSAFAAGALGFVCKDAYRPDLMDAIRCAASGTRAVCPSIGERIVNDWMRCVPNDDPAHVPLSAIDRQILRMIALGVPTRRIAVELRRGVKAVGKRRSMLMHRLNLTSTAAVTRFAVRDQLLSPEEIDKVFHRS